MIVFFKNGLHFTPNATKRSKVLGSKVLWGRAHVRPRKAFMEPCPSSPRTGRDTARRSRGLNYSGSHDRKGGATARPRVAPRTHTRSARGDRDNTKAAAETYAAQESWALLLLAARAQDNEMSKLPAIT